MSFGVDTSFFALADTNLRFLGSEKRPVKNWAEAADCHADVVAQTAYDTHYEYTDRYALVSGTKDLSTLNLGPVNSKCATKIDVGTSNQEFPTIEVAGEDAPDTAALSTYALPAITISGVKKAQKFEGTIGAACRLTASTLSASASATRQHDSTGNAITSDIGNGRVEVSHELVGTTGDPAWTDTATYNGNGVEHTGEAQAYSTGRHSAWKALTAT